MNYWLVSGICAIIAAACFIFMAIISFIGDRKGWGIIYTLFVILDIFIGVGDFMMKPEISMTSLIINIIAVGILISLVIACIIVSFVECKNENKWRIDTRDVY